MKTNPAEVPSKWAWHYRTLLRLRDALRLAANEHETAGREPFERDGADALDRATDETEDSNVRAELAREGTELAEVEAALGRLAAGTYGICEATGLPIAPERLRALPWTRWSKAAAERRESGRR
jgi:RNA polymerase-binding transcription factor DksA